MEQKQAQLKRDIAEPNYACCVDWTKAQHPTITIIDGDKALGDEYTDNKMLGEKPIILKSSEVLKKVFTYTDDVKPDARFLTWIGKWEGSFAKTAKAQSCGYATAPAYTKHCAEQIDPFTKHFLPESQAILPDAHPKLTELCSKPWFFGMTSVYSDFDVPSEGFGSLRVYTLGAVEHVCVSGKDLHTIANAFRGQAFELRHH